MKLGQALGGSSRISTFIWKKKLSHVDPSDSFVHCFLKTDHELPVGSEPRIRIMQGVEEMFLEIGVSFQMDHSRYPYVFPESYYAYKYHIMRSRPITNKHIRIEDYHAFKNVSAFTCIRELSLNFKNPPSGARPLMKNCTFTNIGTLSIYYEDLPPIFENVNVLRTDSPRFSYMGTQLIICHTPSLSPTFCTPLDVPSCDPSEIDFGVLNRDGAFLCIVVIGGHDCIVEQLVHAGTAHLIWKQTCRQSRPLTVIDEPLSSGINFETFLYNAVLPRIDATYIANLHITSHNGLVMPDIHIDDGFRCLHYFTIHCYRPSVPSTTETEPIKIPRVADVTPLMHRELGNIGPNTISLVISVRDLKQVPELTEESWLATRNDYWPYLPIIKDMVP